MWYQYRCYRPVILLKRSLWRFFLAQVVAEVHDIHGRLHRIQQLLRLSTEKTDVETGGLTRWVHFYGTLILCHTSYMRIFTGLLKKKSDILQGTVSRDWQWKMW